MLFIHFQLIQQITTAYSEICQTTKKELLGKIADLNYFRKKLSLKFSARFWIIYALIWFFYLNKFILKTIFKDRRSLVT